MPRIGVNKAPVVPSDDCRCTLAEVDDAFMMAETFRRSKRDVSKDEFDRCSKAHGENLTETKR